MDKQVKPLKKSKKFRLLKRWRKWMAEANRLQIEGRLIAHISGIQEVSRTDITSGAFENFVHFEFSDGVTEVFERDFWMIKALKKAAYKIYIIQTQKIIYG